MHGDMSQQQHKFMHRFKETSGDIHLVMEMSTLQGF
jgi:hypothetical protein